MEAVFSVGDIRKIETQWASQHDNSTWGLMVRAAESFVRQYLGSLQQGLVLIVVGNGNNGGDGYYIGKLLIEAGLNVLVFPALGRPSEDIDAHRARTAYLAAKGIEVQSIPDKPVGQVIDALFGIGLSRSLDGEVLALVRNINQLSVPVFAVDIPSGLDATTGLALPEAILATATHSFIGYKPGLLTHSGPFYCGKLSLDTLGIAQSSKWRYVTELPELPQRIGNTHKSEQGTVRVVGGQQTMAGAAIIAANAALNAGAGRVYLHCDQAFFSSALAVAPELMTADDLKLSEGHDEDVFVVGPGLGKQERACELWSAIINRPQCRGVMDADALRLLAEQPKDVPNWVLTPHEGEAAALLGVTSTEVQKNRVQAAIELSRKYHSTVVLKGAGSIVATEAGLTFCHPGSAAMATPGMGDCLAGIIGSLIAQGLSLEQAAITGTNWHAHSGRQLAQQQRVVLASDIVQRLKYHLA